MDMESILRNMEAGDGQTKVASSQKNVGEAEAQALAAALEKVAAAPAAPRADDNPVNGLVKMATAIAGTEEDRDIAIAAACGSAFADQAIAKLAQYDAEARAEMAKVATVNPGQFAERLYPSVTTADIQKIAAETTVGVLRELAKAEESGYQKEAADYQQGWDQALQHTFEAAKNEFFKGAAEAQLMVDAIRAQQ